MNAVSVAVYRVTRRPDNQSWAKALAAFARLIAAQAEADELVNGGRNPFILTLTRAAILLFLNVHMYS